MNRNQKETFSVLLFAADFFSYASLKNLSDEELMQTAVDNQMVSSMYDSLEEFQIAFNNDEVDEVNNFIFFVKNPPAAEFPERVLKELKDLYKEDSICMGELLAWANADDLTIEQAFELYIKAKQWADGDKFYIQRDDEEQEELLPQ